MNYPTPVFTKNDKKANIIIWSVSLIVFIAVIVLHEIKIEVKLEKDAMLAHNLGVEAAEYALKRGAKDIINKLPKEKRLH